MKKYERSINFKTLFLTFVRRFEIMIILFVPIALGTIIYSQFFIKKEFKSDISFMNYYSVIKDSEYTNFSTCVKSSGVLSKTAYGLKDKGIFHANGKEITAEEISDGIYIAPNEANTIYIRLSFTSEDKTISQPVLNELADVTRWTLLTEKSYGLSGISIVGEASEAKDSGKRNKTLYLGLGAGLAASILCGFISEIIFDEVYDKSDVEMMGCACYEVSLSKGGKE
jgi:capsular polysaccharide biosynthesis protein